MIKSLQTSINNYIVKILMKLLKGVPSSVRQGLFFGLNSGVITTTGLLAGLSQTTTNPLLIVVSIVSLAISDGASEAFGLFISKKAEKTSDKTKEPFVASMTLLITKAVIVLSFLIPFLFTRSLKYFKNLIWPIGWSFFLLFILDLILCNMRNEPLSKYLIPHVIVVGIVLASTKIFGNFIDKLQKNKK